MKHWWEIATEDQAGQPARPRAVAYYRHSAQDRQENSIPIQQGQVHEWAEKPQGLKRKPTPRADSPASFIPARESPRRQSRAVIRAGQP
jgi:hypothetical protein